MFNSFFTNHPFTASFNRIIPCPLNQEKEKNSVNQECPWSFKIFFLERRINFVGPPANSFCLATTEILKVDVILRHATLREDLLTVIGSHAKKTDHFREVCLACPQLFIWCLSFLNFFLNKSVKQAVSNSNVLWLHVESDKGSGTLID